MREIYSREILIRRSAQIAIAWFCLFQWKSQTENGSPIIIEIFIVGQMVCLLERDGCEFSPLYNLMYFIVLQVRAKLPLFSTLYYTRPGNSPWSRRGHFYFAKGTSLENLPVNGKLLKGFQLGQHQGQQRKLTLWPPAGPCNSRPAIRNPPSLR